MRLIFGIVISWLLLIPVAAEAQNRDEGMTPVRGLYVKKGDVNAGRKAFLDLKCTACHWVGNDKQIQQGPVAEKSGPVLGAKQAQYARGWLADVIISPSHTLAIDSDGLADKSQLSRMGDFTETMTVRQLIDVVAYLRSLKSAPEMKSADIEKNKKL